VDGTACWRKETITEWNQFLPLGKEQHVQGRGKGRGVVGKRIELLYSDKAYQ